MFVFEEIVEIFDFLEDWEECYCYVIELGKVMLLMDFVLQVFVIKVEGCVSQVWIMFWIEVGIFDFQGDSDVLIVCGLIVILYVMYFGVLVGQVVVIDVFVELWWLGLEEYLLV